MTIENNVQYMLFACSLWQVLRQYTLLFAHTHDSVFYLLVHFDNYCDDNICYLLVHFDNYCGKVCYLMAHFDNYCITFDKYCLTDWPIPIL